MKKPKKMDKALERVKNTIIHLECINDVLKGNDEYEFHLNELEDQLEKLDGKFLDTVYPSIDEGSRSRNMALSDMLQYVLFGRGYYEVTSRQTSRTKNRSYENFYKILLRLINLLYLQDSILTQEENHDLRKDLVSNLKEKLDAQSSSSYEEVKEWDSFLYQSWGERESIKGRKSIYSKLDQLLPKVRGNPNELITYIHLIRKRMGYVIPLLTHQKIMGAPSELDEKEIFDKLTPPDLLLIKRNKEIYGIEIGRGRGGGNENRQINKFTVKTGIPVIIADTNNISNHRCPKCMKWTLFCPFVIKNGMDKNFREKEKIYCQNCTIEEKEQGRECEYSLIKIAISEFYDNEAHYHYQCVKEYFETKEESFEVNDDEIFSYFPYVEGLDVLQKS